MKSALINEDQTELRNKLLEEVKQFRNEQKVLLPQLSSLAAILTSVTGKILLPSDLPAAERTEYGLQTPAEFELKLRVADAFQIISSLKDAIRDVTQLEYEADKYTRSKYTCTRTGAAMNSARDRRTYWKDEYRSVYAAMLSLGWQADDTSLRLLADEDLYRPSTIAPHEFGSGAKRTGWIWTVSTGKTFSVSSIDFEREGK